MFKEFFADNFTITYDPILQSAILQSIYWSFCFKVSLKIKTVFFDNCLVFGSSLVTRYPLTGCRDYYDASLYQVSKYGYFWTASPGDEHRVYCLYLNPSASGYPVNTMYDKGRASGLAIRCVKE